MKPVYEPDNDKWTYEMKMIEYEALTEIYMFAKKLCEKDEDDKPVLAKISN